MGQPNTIPNITSIREPTPNTYDGRHKPVLLKPLHQPAQHFKSFHLCLLNVRSFGNDDKAGKIRDFVEHEGFDCTVFTETWLRQDDSSTHQIGDITPNGFSFYHRARVARKVGGVGVLIRSAFKAKQLSHNTYKSFEYMRLSISTSKSHINLVAIYSPPPSVKNKLMVEMFFTEFSLLEELNTAPGNLLILGDFNLHVDNSQNAPAMRFLNLLESCNLTQHVTKSTHNSGHILDLVITRSTDSLITTLHNFNPGISDHEAVIFELKVNKPRPVTKTISYRSLGKVSYEKLSADIDASFMMHDHPISINDVTAHYNRELCNIIDKHAPIKTKTIVDRTNCDWFTDELGAMKSTLRTLECKHKRTQLQVDRDIYDMKCHEYNNLRAATKTNYYTNKVYDCLNDQGSIFKIINSLLHRSKASPLPSYDDKSLLANDFASFFDNKILKIHKFLSIGAGSLSHHLADPEPPAETLLSSQK